MVTSCRTELPLPGGAIPDIARAGVNAFVKSFSIELTPSAVKKTQPLKQRALTYW